MIQRDQDYWNEYYRQKRAEDHPSLFARYVMSRLGAGQNLIDLGCGNGRDALYFCHSLIDVTAVDQSDIGITMIRDVEPEKINCVCGDITKLSSFLDESSFDNAYSRFSIHALTEAQQRDLLKEVSAVLKPGGKFWIEVRGVKDNLFGVGEVVGRNAYIHDGHYRRFIVINELVHELEVAGFEIVYAEESTGFAPYREEDPVVIRVTASKK